MPLKTDVELVAEFQRGSVEAFNTLVRRYQEKVYWIARRVVGSHEDADDVVQDVFVKVYQGLTSFRGDSNFFTWLYRIAMNVSLNAVQKKRVREFVPFDDYATVHNAGVEQTDAPLLQQEYQYALQQAIDRLPPKQKLVFVMRYYDELPYEEIAKVLHRSVGGLKANYFHAFKKIQAYVRKELKS
jgi:RNA polymerase sigma factor (sigma-70 family)